METILNILNFLITIVLAAFLVLFGRMLFKSWGYRQKFALKEESKNHKKVEPISETEYTQVMMHGDSIRKKWERISEKVRVGDEKDLHMAIIKADSLLDEVLIEHGYPGKDMGERLKNFHKEDLKNINQVWEAHKIRNKLVHEPDYHIPLSEAKELINIYHEALEELLSKEMELV